MSKQLVVLGVAQVLLATITITSPLQTVLAAPTSAAASKVAPPKANAKPATSTDKAASSGGKSRDSEETHRRHKNRHKHDSDEQRGHHLHHHDNLPNFRAVRQLESLTPVQQNKITQIMRDMREESLPLARKLKNLREESYGEDISVSKKKERSPEAMQMKRQLHAIRMEAWIKMQRVLTAHQKIEVEAQRVDDFGPRRRHDSEAQPKSHDSGSSFSK